MKLFVLFAAVLVLGFVSCQTVEFENKLLIDSFQVPTDAIVIVIPSGGISSNQQPLSDSEFATGASILGGERDLLLQVTQGSANVVLSTSISAGDYTSATPNAARGLSTYSLDGVDGSTTVNPSGLFSASNNDFTSGGASAFRLNMESDQATSVIFEVYSGSISSYCRFEQAIPGDNIPRFFVLNFDSFTRIGSGCDFSNVGAFVIQVQMLDNVDIVINEINTWGPVSNCNCFCPQFTCEIKYDYDDDDFFYFDTSDFNAFPPPFPTGNPSPVPTTTRTPTPSNTRIPTAGYYTYYLPDDVDFPITGRSNAAVLVFPITLVMTLLFALF